MTDPASAFAGFWQPPKLPDAHMAMIPMEKIEEIEKKYLENIFAIWSGKSPIELSDHRFKSSAWHEGWSEFILRSYLVNAQHLVDLAKAVDVDAKAKKRLLFATEQFISSMAPSNFLATNPEAINEMIATKGESLANGIQNFLGDMQEGKISQTDTSKFEFGVNVANSVGAIVYENRIFQLIQYKPLTATVYQKPLLMVPPCINKYYILDLQKESSMVQYFLNAGITVFMVSWKSADEQMTEVTWDDYVSEGIIKALQVTIEISKLPKINVLGFCVGGTLLASGLAVLAANDIEPAASLILLASFLDFQDTGVLDVFIDESTIEMTEKTIGGSAGRYGLLGGDDLANTFSALRPNDLVWNYVVGNYLLGKSPTSFDLLYWNSDTSNLPGPMFAWYLRHMYLQNELKIPDRLEICGTKINLSRITCPAYIYASKEDHIVPWQTAYLTNQLLPGEKRFVLGASGHIAGVINPPQKKKRNYWINPQIANTPQDWLSKAKSVDGSWWPDCVAWLVKQSGKKVKSSPSLGNRQYQVVEPAPGRYVREKAVKVSLLKESK